MHAVDTLRISTAGSVDDGKSTLIGRLLFDAHGILEDQLRTLEGATRRHGHVPAGEAIDFSLLTDGLIAEREQGITIDVAYRYFTTATRRFIIADTPGHEQYTRNMVTGASTADLAIILVDAARGLTSQSRRHAVIASLLRIPQVVVAVNKMDLVGYDEAVYQRHVADLKPFLDALSFAAVSFVPMSALNGEMLAKRGENMSWNAGQTLLEILQTTQAHLRAGTAFRFPVQRIAKTKFGPNADLRGLQGRVEGGSVRTGDTVRVQPAGLAAVVTEIHQYDSRLDHAEEGQSVTIVLDRQVDVSRGDLLTLDTDAWERAQRQDRNALKVRVDRAFPADICWLDNDSLSLNRRYWLKQGTMLTKAIVPEIAFRLNVETLARDVAAEPFQVNEIGRVRVETQRPLAFDAYGDNRATGAFVLIDETTNRTVAAGMICDDNA
jgi:sulfate adenylyltransferase subunit 1